MGKLKKLNKSYMSALLHKKKISFRCCFISLLFCYSVVYLFQKTKENITEPVLKKTISAYISDRCCASILNDENRIILINLFFFWIHS